MKTVVLPPTHKSTSTLDIWNLVSLLLHGVVLHLGLALLSFLLCVFLLARSRLCNVYLLFACYVSTITLPSHHPDSDYPYSSKSTSSSFLHIFLPSKFRVFRCMISTSSGSTFRTSSLHNILVSSRFPLLFRSPHPSTPTPLAYYSSATATK